MKTIAYFCPSSMPNQRMVRGIQDSEGSGRMIERMGSNSALAVREVPSTMPSGTATAAASRNPTSTRRALVNTCQKRLAGGGGENKSAQPPAAPRQHVPEEAAVGQVAARLPDDLRR